jgi:hypothetical protein
VFAFVFKKKWVYIDDPLIKSDEKTNPRVVFLSRSVCFETVKQFPFSATRDIKDAIMSDILEYCPFETDLFFIRKIHEKDGKTAVNLWFVLQQAADIVFRLTPWLIVPETFLLSTLADASSGVFQAAKPGGQTLYFYVNKKSALKSAQTQNAMEANAFLRTCPVFSDTPVKQIAGENEYTTFLEALFLKTPLRKLLIFVNRKLHDPGTYIKNGVRCAYACMILVLLYFTAAGYLVYQKKEALIQQDTRLSRQTAGLEEKVEMLKEKTALLEEMQTLVASYQPRTNILALVLEHVPEKSRITHLTISGNTVEIQASAPDASRFMDALVAGKHVSRPEFTSPVRKNSKTGMDSFTILFQYKEQ